MTPFSILPDSDWCRPPLSAFYLTGATASGKTPLALAVAERLGAEILSLDSMAIYRGMDIGTAKPTAEQRSRVPHHLLDIVDPTESYSVSCYVEAAHAAAADVRAAGRKVLVGRMLYLKSPGGGLFLDRRVDEDFRRSVEADIAEFGLDSLRSRLVQVDPLAAHKLHPHDQRRMVRALEVARATGRPLSHWQTQFDTPARGVEIKAAVLGIDRAWLHERINRRVCDMIAQGLENEVRSLVDRYGQLGHTAAQAVGYREVLAHFNGEWDRDQMTAEIQAHTRQFARRQEIWFRGLEELRRFEMTPAIQIDAFADEIATWFESSN
ncbi:MAG: tRNA (adenosine(37)-N6)-dimethylallyltransferase MiaA [Pirellulales bacterium]